MRYVVAGEAEKRARKYFTGCSGRRSVVWQHIREKPRRGTGGVRAQPGSRMEIGAAREVRHMRVRGIMLVHAVLPCRGSARSAPLRHPAWFSEATRAVVRAAHATRHHVFNGVASAMTARDRRRSRHAEGQPARRQDMAIQPTAADGICSGPPAKPAVPAMSGMVR